MAAALNRHCTCRSLDEARLRHQLEREPALHGLAGEIRNSRPHLFSPTAVFLAPADLAAMAAIVRAVETVVALPAWRTEVLARSPAIAAFDPGPRGAFLGFDFHLCADGPKLIEINTNPGGALLNGALARAQQACCTEFAALMRPSADLDALDAHWQQMFLEEWRLQRGSGRPQRIAIVDHGRVLAEGALADLLASPRPQLDIELDGPLPAELAERYAASAQGNFKFRLFLPSTAALAGLLDQLAAAGRNVCQLSLGRHDLEQLFMQLTSRSLRD